MGHLGTAHPRPCMHFQVLAGQVEENTPLPQTKAGVIVTDKVEDVYAACKTEVKDLKDVYEQEKGIMTEEFERTLLAERERAEAALVEARKNRDAWRELDDKRRNYGRVGRWFARGAAVVGGGLLTIATGGFGGPAALIMYGAVEGGAQVHKEHEDERTRTEGAKYNHI